MFTLFSIIIVVIVFSFLFLIESTFHFHFSLTDLSVFSFFCYRFAKCNCRNRTEVFDKTLHAIRIDLDHYNLSIVRVSNKDEGTFQCQVQRTMDAHEARSERVQLTLIGKIERFLDEFSINFRF